MPTGKTAGTEPETTSQQASAGSSGQAGQTTGQTASSGTQAGSNEAQAGSSGTKSPSTAGSAQKTQTAGGAVEALTADHRRVDALFKEFEKASSARKDKIVSQICQELVVHTLLEEEIFYPACREAADDEEPLDEAQVEHDSAKTLIADLMQGGRSDRYRDAKVKVLAEQIRHHVAEEEKPKEGVFAKAKEAGIDTPDLAQRLQALKQELQQAPEDLPRPRPVSIKTPTQQSRMEEYMPRGGNYRERDDQGRFMSDDDDRGGRGRGGGGRSRYDDDDDGRGWYGDSRGHAEAARRGWEERRGESRSFSRGRDDDDDYRGGGRGRERDERGRFMSDDDDDRGYRSRSRYDDDDDRGGGRGRGQGGWFGDPEGHSEASRRGWEERGGGGGSRSRSRYDDDDDDRGYRSRGGGDRERDERGRFTSDDDDRGGGSRSRSRYDDDDDRGGRGGGGGGRGGGRSQGGWFGDSEGHAEAARRGWEERGGGGSRSRGRDDDDDRGGRGGGGRGGGGRGRGQGGWFGDSEGHAEAARRGWEDRR